MDYMDQIEAEATVAIEARQRFSETDSYQGVLKSNYQRWHHYFQPEDGDQWPEDAALRPNKIHVTLNIIKPAVIIDSRLQSLLPRISLIPDGLGDQQRSRAEAAEKLELAWLEMSGWDVWLGTLCRVRSIYGKGALKVFWNKEDRRPDVRVIENPANLRIGWGSSDFSVMDWALYEYSISVQEAKIRFPGLSVTTARGADGRQQLLVQQTTTDHEDILGNKNPSLGGTTDISRPIPYQPSDYEQKQLRVWDYWYKKPDGKGGQTICNAMFVEGVLVQPAGAKSKISMHNYLPDIPYIIVRQDAEPGNPEGLSMVEDLIDLQYELNRAMAHWMQLVADEVDPAWVLEGDNADSVPAGTVPKGGHITPAGSGNHILPLNKAVQLFPIVELINSIWDHYHKITGLSPITFGEVPGAQASGRAVAIQVESTSNRLDPRRRLLYDGLKELLVFWAIMAERVNPKFSVGTDPDTGRPIMMGTKDIISGFRRWKIIPPEITPRDVYENTNNEINKVNSKLSSLKTSMDQLGIDSPEDELKLIQAERMNAQLFPGDVQSYVAIFPMLLQVQQQMSQMQQQLGQLQQMGQQGGVPGGGMPPGGGLPPGLTPGGGVVAQGQTAQNVAQQQAFAAQPQAVAEDQNQPATAAGGPPPGGGQGPATTTLIRGGQALNQLAYRS